MFKKLVSLITLLCLAFGLGVPVASFAAIDLTTLTGAITATDVTVGVLAVAAIFATIYATTNAAGMVLSMIRRGRT